VDTRKTCSITDLLWKIVSVEDIVIDKTSIFSRVPDILDMDNKVGEFIRIDIQNGPYKTLKRALTGGSGGAGCSLSFDTPPLDGGGRNTHGWK
jgi:hypothetical protein